MKNNTNKNRFVLAGSHVLSAKGSTYVYAHVWVRGWLGVLFFIFFCLGEQKEHFINLLKSRKNELSESACFKLRPSG